MLELSKSAREMVAESGRKPDQLALVTTDICWLLSHNIDRHVSGDSGEVFLEAYETDDCTVRLVPFGSPAREPPLLPRRSVSYVEGRGE
jgi:hypothetical protein